MPGIKALAAGKRDAELLLAAAFNPLVHAVLDSYLAANAPALLGVLQRLTSPPAPGAATRFVEPNVALCLLAHYPASRIVAAFDLRPGGRPEFDAFTCVSLFDDKDRIPRFYQEVLPRVIDVLRGWGAMILVISPPDTPRAQAKAQLFSASEVTP